MKTDPEPCDCGDRDCPACYPSARGRYGREIPRPEDEPDDREDCDPADC